MSKEVNLQLSRQAKLLADSIEDFDKGEFKEWYVEKMKVIGDQYINMYLMDKKKGNIDTPSRLNTDVNL
jgi:hypothetical protein